MQKQSMPTLTITTDPYHSFIYEYNYDYLELLKMAGISINASH